MVLTYAYFTLFPPTFPLGLFMLLNPSGYFHITGSHPKLVHCDPDDKTVWYLHSISNNLPNHKSTLLSSMTIYKKTNK